MPLGLQTCQYRDAREHMHTNPCSLHKLQAIKADNPTLKTPASLHGGPWPPLFLASSALAAGAGESIHLRFLHLHLHQLLGCPRMGQAQGLDYGASFLEGSCRRESQ